jgi:hypothetical protein
MEAWLWSKSAHMARLVSSAMQKKHCIWCFFWTVLPKNYRSTNGNTLNTYCHGDPLNTYCHGDLCEEGNAIVGWFAIMEQYRNVSFPRIVDCLSTVKDLVNTRYLFKLNELSVSSQSSSGSGQAPNAASFRTWIIPSVTVFLLWKHTAGFWIYE